MLAMPSRSVATSESPAGALLSWGLDPNVRDRDARTPTVTRSAARPASPEWEAAGAQPAVVPPGAPGP
ncbi:hypothetical protein GCM10010384_02720 [Streptomyces djakartensis]|uniref:Uncharacterized protein n=1 Tax=Streptomyces djakartensis TaxID=68193 RepID=A0ABQ2Z4V5_9ACTN|nr:hypothetical protein GCM10010384_02720 [Streptomyces djakartensis]